MIQRTSEKLGLTISGGGIKGIAALAIVDALVKAGIKFDAISGTSVGAIIGSYLALNGEVESLATKILSMSTKDWIKMLDLGIAKGPTILKGNKFRSLFKDIYGEKTFAEIKTPLIIPATDLRGGTAHYFTEGKIYDAITATCAYPGILPPHIINEKQYADGGITDNIPYEVLLKAGIDKVIVINLVSINKNTSTDYSSMGSLIIRSLDILMTNALKSMHLNDPRLFIYNPEFPQRITGTIQIGKVKEYYKIGLECVDTQKQKLIEWL